MKIFVTALALMFAAPMMGVSAGNKGETKTTTCECGCTDETKDSKECKCKDCPHKDTHEKKK